jgi:hypothetical protein
MMSLTDVTCPHCGAHGQIMTPPTGAIIVGPCPECEDMVVLFCGRVLPLDSDTIKNKPIEEKKKHLMAVLSKFLTERIDFIFDRTVGESEEDVLTQANQANQAPQEAQTHSEHARKGPIRAPREHISQEELQKFVQVDLPLLDNPEYFDSIFG